MQDENLTKEFAKEIEARREKGPSGSVPDEACLYVVYDAPADKCSPVFEQSSDLMAERIFRLQTCAKAPEGYDVADLILYRVGKRHGNQVLGLDYSEKDGKIDYPYVVAKGADYVQN